MSSKRILVTGASTGIGRACAVRLANRGFTVFAGVRKHADGDALRADTAGDLRPIPLDVTLPESIQDALAAMGDDPLGGLVNNAGIAIVGPLELVPIERWRRQFEVNVLGLVAVTQAVLPLLRAGGGRIVNIGSIAGRAVMPGASAYNASKFAIEAITDALRMEVRSSNISVSVIEPGAIGTPIWEKSLSEIDGLTLGVAPERYGHYVKLIAAMREAVVASAGKAASVSQVVKAVEHALTASRPRTRYLVGADTRFMLMLNLLPDRWRDWLILRRLNR